MDVREAIEAYRYAILQHSQSTQIWTLSRLNTFAAWCENTSFHDGRVLQLQDLTATEIRKYIYHLCITPSTAHGKEGKLLSSYTVHGHARIIRTFLNWYANEDGYDEYVSEKIPKKMKMPKIEQKIIEVFTAEQLKALFIACKREYADHLQVRDIAILSTLIDTGIRANELCTLTLENVHLNPHDAYITVHGKGKKDREVGLGIQARTILYKYIRRYRNSTRTVQTRTVHESERHVFILRHSKLLTVSGLDQILYRLGDWAHIKGVRVSAHTFRHTFACNYLAHDGDVFKLSCVLGHASVQITTDVYLRAFKAKEARKGRSVLDDLL